MISWYFYFAKYFIGQKNAKKGIPYILGLHPNPNRMKRLRNRQIQRYIESFEYTKLLVPTSIRINIGGILPTIKEIITEQGGDFKDALPALDDFEIGISAASNWMDNFELCAIYLIGPNKKIIPCHFEVKGTKNSTRQILQQDKYFQRIPAKGQVVVQMVPNDHIRIKERKEFSSSSIDRTNRTPIFKIYAPQGDIRSYNLVQSGTNLQLMVDFGQNFIKLIEHYLLCKFLLTPWLNQDCINELFKLIYPKIQLDISTNWSWIGNV